MMTAQSRQCLVSQKNYGPFLTRAVGGGVAEKVKTGFRDTSYMILEASKWTGALSPGTGMICPWPCCAWPEPDLDHDLSHILSTGNRPSTTIA